MTYDDSNRDAKAPQFSCTDGTNFTFTNNGKAHTGTLEKSGEKYILHYSDSNKTMEATISGKDNRDFRERQHASGVRNKVMKLQD